MTTKDQWVWMPHAGHFICGHECRFHLNTYVVNFVVSTVGELWPDSRVRAIHAKCQGIVINGRGDAWDADYMQKIGFHEVGLDRKYETMVSRAKRGEHGCCPWCIELRSSVDFAGYNDAEDAFKGHMAMCEKWAGVVLAVEQISK